MLEAIEDGPAPLAVRRRVGRSACATGPPGRALIVLTETARSNARRACWGSTPSAACRSPTASTPTHFGPRQLDHATLWRRHARRGAARVGAGRDAACATTRRLSAFARRRPVLLYVGRFTEVKRIPLLIEAYTRARPGFSRRAPLVIVGGFPGEWEGEHPLDAIRRTGRGRLPGRLARPRRAGRHLRRRRRRSCCRRCASSSAR